MAVLARPRVVVTRRLPDAIEARMRELFDVVPLAEERPPSPDRLAALIADADVLVPTIVDRIDATLIAAAGPRLKLIANYGNGVDHIDLAAARARDILVTNTPGVLTDDAADMAMALILAVPRRLSEGERLVRSGEWAGWGPTAMLGRRVSGKKLGIVGMGRIGQAIALRARGFGIAIHYHNRRRLPHVVEKAVDATYHAELDDMLTEIDMLSINCPHNASTHHLIDARRLALLGRQGYLINIARGEIVDEPALIAALEQGVIAGAGLDVFAHEPAVDPRLIGLPNVVLLPHMASATIEARHATGEKVIANIRIWADGHRPPDQVLEGWA
ncbi:D-glycerate dehydrogenase [Sphingomonas changnyeongensis]|uniref:D-glycerate dehydrogenase n=1 Tax=Sphingomonas changnyeongensis TaxID=2698679 RepID=A0A7Z2NWT8_9SPHN|nr:D-glycerate dehydrogenase [Sphingomonas changnyeongensis]QHL90896.1 D-glycerate dehydrogenase [Sphingomonas changnyeongensis]